MKPLAWNILRNYVEPLLFWKGDTKTVASGNQDPEGSDEFPGRDVARDLDWVTVGRGLTGARMTVNDAATGSDLSMVRVLTGNRFQALTDA